MQRCLFATLLELSETAAVSARSVYTIQSCTTSRHFMQSHVRKAHACLAVTSHLHFWQNDRDLFPCYCGKPKTDTQTGVNTKSWPWRRTFSCRSCRASNPRPFDHESGALTIEPFPPRQTDRQTDQLPSFIIKYFQTPMKQTDRLASFIRTPSSPS